MNHFSRLFSFIFLFSSFLFFSYTPSVSAANERYTDIFSFHQNTKAKKTKSEKIFHANSFGKNGGSVALCNLYGDRLSEVVIGSGHGETPMVKILQKQKKNKSGKKKWRVVKQFQPYEKEMTAGVNVACGVLEKKERPYIVTAPSVGAGPQVKVFNRNGKTQRSFFAFDKDFRGGVNVAVAEVKEGKKSRIVASTGPGERSLVRMFRLKKKGVIRELQLRPFSDEHEGGATVAAGDVDGDQKDEVIVSVAGFAKGHVQIYDLDKGKKMLTEFSIYDTDFTGGANVAAADVTKDGKEEIVTIPAARGGSDVRTYTFSDGKVERIGKNFFAYEKDFMGGAMIAASDAMDHDRSVEIVTIPKKNLMTGKAEWQKYIEVNLATQTLTAWENGVPVKEMLISSGLAPNVTPTGEFEIMRHVYNMTYSWPYAPGHPDNEYNLENVQYNMEFTRYYYFHNAYWHNNFGNPMSHGCVNLNLENSKWLYEWADVGDKVWVH